MATALDYLSTGAVTTQCNYGLQFRRLQPAKAGSDVRARERGFSWLPIQHHQAAAIAAKTRSTAFRIDKSRYQLAVDKLLPMSALRRVNSAATPSHDSLTL